MTKAKMSLHSCLFLPGLGVALVSEHLALDITLTFNLLMLKSSITLNSFVLTAPERIGICYFCLLDEKLRYRKRERQILKIICVFQSSLISVGVYVLSVHQFFGMSQGINMFLLISSFRNEIFSLNSLYSQERVREKYSWIIGGFFPYSKIAMMNQLGS